MKKNGIKRNGRRSGFTLLEILVVVAIIALLAAFVVPNLIGVSQAQEIKITKTAVSNSGPIAMAIDTFRLDVGRYPKELSELTQKPDDEEEAKKWNGPYIKDAKDLKDAWQREIKYECPGKVNESSYDLWSMGPNGQDGDDDDITNYTKE
ncbi:MAG TPA: type II secretion system major pseudopilin GspG [Phycisphaerae bacterium]|nr:type II secretion system major pseudopilin GspG [Phycisphaerae bacterium]HOJ73186.1 type II secretion system major pseudopilin GspG [Phycisphaerae bacterium]HOM52161.1 type II secretion system major pseudopilin GspG [Phycisphaerae bacterium]HON67787.1 type II secretion system major pseudopilin GspG [Phycisphaerae bacterium]HOQ85317.1 type II secretion system major pseudopilin GspG [Phycisphaerae bacterium]